MLYDITQLLAMAILTGIAAAILTWTAMRSYVQRLLTRQRTELDTRLAWRAVEHEQALAAANEGVRIAQEGRREAEVRLTQARAEAVARVTQADEAMAGVHRSLRAHQERIKELQERAEIAEARAAGEAQAERRLAAAQERVRELEARVAQLVASQRGPDRDTLAALEKQVRDAQEANRELEVKLRTAQAATSERGSLERRLVEAQERLRTAEGELTGTSNELSRLRVAHQIGRAHV